MFANLTGWHLLIILAVVLLMFGAPKLPGLARSLGQSARIFKSEVKMMKDEADASVTSQDGIDVSAAKPASVDRATPGRS